MLPVEGKLFSVNIFFFFLITLSEAVDLLSHSGDCWIDDNGLAKLWAIFEGDIWISAAGQNRKKQNAVLKL